MSAVHRSWAAFKRYFPDFAAEFYKQWAANKKRGRAYWRAKQAAEKQVAKTYPNWKKTVQSPQFSQWLYAQPKKIKDLCGSERAEDAIKVLRLYDEARH